MGKSLTFGRWEKAAGDENARTGPTDGPGPITHLRKVSKKTWLYSSDQTRNLLSSPDIVALGDVDDAAEGVGYH